MTYRRNIERRIEKEQNKINELREQINRTEVFIEGLQEALKMLPKDTNSSPRKGKGAIREGSDMAKVRDLIKRAGRPMRIEEIVAGLGRPDTKANKMSLSGSLGRLVRNGVVFNRPKANTFSLIGMQVESIDELPPDFGVEEITSDDIPF